MLHPNRAGAAGFLLAAGCGLIFSLPAAARKPPPRVTMDKLLARAEFVVIARVQLGSVRQSPSGPYRELTLLVSSALKGKADNEIAVTCGNFPAREFPKSKEHPHGRFLLTGWNERGHTDTEPRGLDLYAEQVWFIERAADPRLKAVPWIVAHNESVQDRAYVPLIRLLLNKGTAAGLRTMIAKAYVGDVPPLVVEALYGSNDPNAGTLCWEYLRRIEDRAKSAKGRPEYDGGRAHPATAFRTLNSLGREEALKWARKALGSSDEVIRLFAFETVKRFADAASVPALLRLLDAATSHEEQVRLMETLGIVGDARAVPALIDRLCQPDGDAWQAAQRALFRLTDIRLSPNGNVARDWYSRNKNRPRWHWLKQGIEQDLYLLTAKPTTEWRYEQEPLTHLSRATCWWQKKASAAKEWRMWWRANKDLPQERWVLDSFRAVGHPLPDLGSAAAVDALVKALNTTPARWWDEGPVFDMYLHPAWCHRLLSRLTGLAIVDTEYAHFTEHDYFDTRTYGPKWQTAWQQSRLQIALHPITVPDKQPFLFEDEDRRLISADLDAVRPELSLDGPLIRTQRPDSKEFELRATFVIRLTNASDRPLSFHTKPAVSNTIKSKSATSGYTNQEYVCVESKEEFATVPPGKSVHFRAPQTMSVANVKDRTRYQFHLMFQRSGLDTVAWRGVVDTPFFTIDPATPVVEEGK